MFYNQCAQTLNMSIVQILACQVNYRWFHYSPDLQSRLEFGCDVALIPENDLNFSLFVYFLGRVQIIQDSLIKFRLVGNFHYLVFEIPEVVLVQIKLNVVKGHIYIPDKDQQGLYHSQREAFALLEVQFLQNLVLTQRVGKVDKAILGDIVVSSKY